MRLHTKLTYAQVYGALRQAKDAGQVTEDVEFIVLADHGSRSRPRAFEVQLGTYDQCSLPAGYRDQYGKLMRVRRFKNTGSAGASSGVLCGDRVWSATWHEWGWFMARVFALDPGAVFGGKGYGYHGREDFNYKTGQDFRLGDGYHRDADGRPYDNGSGPVPVSDEAAFERITADMRRVERNLAEDRINHDTYREQRGEDA